MPRKAIENEALTGQQEKSVALDEISRTRKSRDTFERGQLYPTETICAVENRVSAEYAERLLFEKLETVKRHAQEGLLVDLCCATGNHIASVRQRVGQPAIGIDFSLRYLARAKSTLQDHVNFLVADARALPLMNSTVSTIYSLSALYIIPDIDSVLAEISRVLRIGGRCILDLGNRNSLNSFCVRNYYPELPVSYHYSVSELLAMCQKYGLLVLEHRTFQLLPLWAGRPRWLLPLLHPVWKRVMSRRIGGRMVDEWVSSLPLLRQFAFRHVLVCEKTNPVQLKEGYVCSRAL